MLIPLRKASCLILTLCLLLAGIVEAPEARAAGQELDHPTQSWMRAVLANWKRACRRDLRVSAEPLPWVIFYDESHAWHLKPEERLLPPHKLSPASVKFEGRTHV